MTTALASAVPARSKSPEAFRTISEVSQELGVPQHVLRFWESRFAQVRPVKRAGGRRFYRPEDVALLRGIRSLLYTDGYTIKGVQKVLRERGWRHVAEIGRNAPNDGSWTDYADTTDVDLGEPYAEASAAEAVRDEPAMETLMRLHADAQERVAMEEHNRVRLELLLAELLVLRDRLRGARPKWLAE